MGGGGGGGSKKTTIWTFNRVFLWQNVQVSESFFQSFYRVFYHFDHNPRGLRQWWKIMVATQNIDTLGPIWIFLLRGVLTFVASGLDINGCVWSYFEGTANLHCYTSCAFTTLHCRKVSFLEYCHMKDIKYLQKCEGCTHFCEILYINHLNIAGVLSLHKWTHSLSPVYTSAFSF